ncbi:hypothetical protein BDR06DRAFT_980943 [Suillus hirtellus]|nr:hypothetical protein BDR06DRAFT_980943 [Suillus hirtellus]
MYELTSKQDQYRELMRVGWQWHQLKLLKWNGFAHNRKQLESGELALFCPACPQPGINAPQPAERNSDDPEWIYARSLAMDGNFKAEHLHPTSTGIGGCACTQHGCFVPHSIVDFQKGERYGN